MKTIFLVIISINLLSATYAQKQLTIAECLNLEGFDFYEYDQSDRMPKDTLIDLKNGYYEISDGETKLFQATKFNNKDGSILIAATGFYADMQCSNYFTNFYIKPKSENVLIEIEHEDVFPNLLYTHFFSDYSISYVARKYLTQIQGNYISNATIEDLYNEFFNKHFTLPRLGTKVSVSLTVCDFIPLNEVSIEEKDWNIIEENHKTLSFTYDNEKKIFTQD